MSDKEHQSDSDSEMAECLNGLSSEPADPNRNNEHVQKCLKSRRVLQDDELHKWFLPFQCLFAHLRVFRNPILFFQTSSWPFAFS